MESELVNSNKKVDEKFYKQLTRKISNVNRQLLNTDIHISTLKRLERDAIRNAKVEKPEAKPLRKSVESADYLTLILKSQHRLNENVCIVKLPKMPYGKHSNYNDDKQFVMRHFFNSTSNIGELQSDDLNDIKKKFRLYDKRKQIQRRNSTGRRTSTSDFFDTFDMDHGELICPKVKRVSDDYSKHKEKYRKYIFEDYYKRTKRPKISKETQEKAMERLSSSKHGRRSRLVEKLTTKYSKLFSKQSPNKASSMAEINILNL